MRLSGRSKTHRTRSHLAARIHEARFARRQHPPEPSRPTRLMANEHRIILVVVLEHHPEKSPTFAEIAVCAGVLLGAPPGT